MFTRTDYSYKFLKYALTADPRLESLLQKKSKGEIQFDAYVTEDSLKETQKTKLAAAGTKKYTTLNANTFKGMSALHFACLIGNEGMITSLSTQLPLLREKRRAETGATPLLTLTESIGLVNVVSDEFFRNLLASQTFLLDASDAYNNNIFHHLSQTPRDLQKLEIAIGIFESFKERFKPILIENIKVAALVNIIVEYANPLKDLLDAKGSRDMTVWQVSCSRAKPLLDEAGASKDEFDNSNLLNKTAGC
jgi:hypothetical protein